jgi:PIN domain nuclease of toxin-antitoxin system
MNLLLDTHTLIWFFNGDSQLSEAAKQAILAPHHKKFVSLASVWEFAIKISANKLAFDGNTRGFLELIDSNGFYITPVTKSSILAVEKLPFIHRDPFDRLLVGTAITKNMHIVTHDTNIGLYQVDCIW